MRPRRSAPRAGSTATGVRPDRPPDRPTKRSLTIRGHRTSVTLEDAFWTALREVAEAHGSSLAALAAEIDAARDPGTNLASAIRVHLLSHYRAGCSDGP